jgi:hypothetical protein
MLGFHTSGRWSLAGCITHLLYITTTLARMGITAKNALSSWTTLNLLQPTEVSLCPVGIHDRAYCPWIYDPQGPGLATSR